jgi:hypothetical protein
VIRTDTSSDAFAMRIGKDGAPTALPETLDAASAASAGRLWARIEATIGDLVIHRRHLTAASLGGVSVGEIVHPSAIAETLIEAISPIVREIAARTATPRELALKRTLGDGRREELFISYDTVLDRIKTLTEAHQALFDAFGLRARPPQGAVLRKLPPPPPRRPELRAISARRADSAPVGIPRILLLLSDPGEVSAASVLGRGPRCLARRCRPRPRPVRSRGGAARCRS